MLWMKTMHFLLLSLQLVHQTQLFELPQKATKMCDRFMIMMYCFVVMKWLAWRAVLPITVVAWSALAGERSLCVVTHSVLMAPAWLALIYVCKQDNSQGGRAEKKQVIITRNHFVHVHVVSFYGKKDLGQPGPKNKFRVQSMKKRCRGDEENMTATEDQKEKLHFHIRNTICFSCYTSQIYYVNNLTSPNPEQMV